ncbi:MAG TPA: hypothetical protein VJZ93_04330 [Candidatus Nanoarchaeia archaeon]|nr:hypothetical protein [Candidatus Nanoarchaeia archaeon]
MSRLFLHRVEPLIEDGVMIFRDVPENPLQENCGVKYRLEINTTKDKVARTYGWGTGYPMPCDEGPEGYVYAPDGFRKGSIVFVNIDDDLLTATKYDTSTRDKFFESLKKAEHFDSLDFLDKKFSLIGKVLYVI